MSGTTTKDTEAQAVAASNVVAETKPTTADTPVADADQGTPNSETANEKNEESTPATTEPKRNKYGYLPMLKTTTQIDPSKPDANLKKFNPFVLPVSDDARLIRRQTEFYFSDGNFPTDKHMWNLVGGTENKAVPLKSICSFGRMRRFQPYTAVVAALKESEKLDIEGPEGEETVKRKVPYVFSSESGKDGRARMEASVYVKGFGDETATTQFDLEDFFEPHGKIVAVRLRRTEPEKMFKGSVFVEFDTAEEADRFVKLDPPVHWQGHELLIMKKADYASGKAADIKAGKIKPGHSKPKFFEGRIKEDNNPNRGGPNGFRGRGGRGGHGRGNGRGGQGDRKKVESGENGEKNGVQNGEKKNGNGFNHRGGRGGRGGRGRGNQNGNRGGRRENGPPVIKATNEKGQVIEKGNGKRAREDDTNSAPPAKKVDIKPEATTAA